MTEGGVAPHVTLSLWTSDTALAAAADAAGVDRIGVDLETRGKDSRQAGRGTWMSPHVEGDLSRSRRERPGRPLVSATSAARTMIDCPCPRI